MINIDQIKKNITTCTRCSLSQTRIHAVVGRGNIYAEIMIIGEAPGKSEDKMGSPFVGRAGTILDEALKNAKLTNEDVYITNVVKCRPPKNRVPTKQEQKECSIHLNSEIKLIKPKIICLLGNTAYNSILDGNNITKNHGKIILVDDQKYMPTFHPAALIYNQELKSLFFEDISKLSDLVNDS